RTSYGVKGARERRRGYGRQTANLAREAGRGTEPQKLMRIVGGRYRGRKLLLPEDKRIRPTADRTREALFNILAHDRDMQSEHGQLPRDARVLDVFAGTGALGLEALSRGAGHATFMDNHPGSLKIIRANIQAMN